MNVGKRERQARSQNDPVAVSLSAVATPVPESAFGGRVLIRHHSEVNLTPFTNPVYHDPVYHPVYLTPFTGCRRLDLN